MHRYCRQLLALLCMPAQDTDAAFGDLEQRAMTAAQQCLCQYARSTWAPSMWSVFLRSVHSNSDIEGWHRHLNQNSSHGQLNLYLLLQLLGGVSCWRRHMQLTLLKESAHIWHQRKANHRVTARLFTLWDCLVVDKWTVMQTLRAAVYLLPKFRKCNDVSCWASFSEWWDCHAAFSVCLIALSTFIFKQYESYLGLGFYVKYSFYMLMYSAVKYRHTSPMCCVISV